MRSLTVLIIAAVFIGGCNSRVQQDGQANSKIEPSKVQNHKAPPKTEEQPNEEKKLTVIKHSHDSPFLYEIVGTSFKGISQNNLVETLTKYRRSHPSEEYELYAEFKLSPDRSDKLIEKIRSTGVNLKHYWAPVSFYDPEDIPGKYGPGHVDILNPPPRPNARQPNEEKKLTVIKHSIDSPFQYEIVDTPFKSIPQEDLVEVLTKYSQRHPDEEYEFYAEFKLPPDSSDVLIEKIRSAGVTLKHYWAPFSAFDPMSTPGKYGPGYVDILNPSPWPTANPNDGK